MLKKIGPSRWRKQDLSNRATALVNSCSSSYDHGPLGLHHGRDVFCQELRGVNDVSGPLFDAHDDT